MKKLLTIAIPTYNRAKALDRQLTWLANAIKGFESEVELFVSDNCSTDDTQEVIEKWRAQLKNVTLHSTRNAENIGLMRNVIQTLTWATTKYVWSLGDDDPIQDSAVSYVFNRLRKYDDVSLLFLNFSGRDGVTGKPEHPDTIIGNRWFDIEQDEGDGDGKATFQHCVTTNVGAATFLTAIIFKTETVQLAIRTWPEGVNNWFFYVYISGFCAANGRTIVTKDTYLECITGVSSWQRQPKLAFLIQYRDLPIMVEKLTEVGYSKQFRRAMMVRALKDTNLRVLLGAMRRWPVFVIRNLTMFLADVGRGMIAAEPSRNLRALEERTSSK
jgi:glycosyltransferase involved in cell wall biosynthesis